jgi:hypothetical protein
VTRIVSPGGAQYALDTSTEPGLSLERVSPSTRAYAAFWARHYPGSKGAIGRQLHYLVWLDGQMLGIIAAGEAMFRCAPRDRALGLELAAGTPPPGWLVACSAFRVEDAPYGVPSQVLALWRAAVRADWARLYGHEVRWFETLVEPPRIGTCFVRDGWRRLARRTAGLGARRPDGHGHTKRKVIQTSRKIILVRAA